MGNVVVEKLAFLLYNMWTTPVLTCSLRREGKKISESSSVSVTHQSHSLRVSAERANVWSDPVESSQNVVQSKVSGFIAADTGTRATAQETCDVSINQSGITQSSDGSRIFREGWLWKPDENWGALILRENLMHLWIRTWALAMH